MTETTQKSNKTLVIVAGVAALTVGGYFVANYQASKIAKDTVDSYVQTQMDKIPSRDREKMDLTYDVSHNVLTSTTTISDIQFKVEEPSSKPKKFTAFANSIELTGDCKAGDCKVAINGFKAMLDGEIRQRDIKFQRLMKELGTMDAKFEFSENPDGNIIAKQIIKSKKLGELNYEMNAHIANGKSVAHLFDVKSQHEAKQAGGEVFPHLSLKNITVSFDDSGAAKRLIKFVNEDQQLSKEDMLSQMNSQIERAKRRGQEEQVLLMTEAKQLIENESGKVTASLKLPGENGMNANALMADFMMGSVIIKDNFSFAYSK